MEGIPDPTRGRQISWKHGILRGYFFACANPKPEIRPMAPRLIPYEDLRAKCIRYSKPHLWRLEKAGKFPKRVPVGASRYGYVEDEVDAWISARIAARDEAKAA
jgi:prophage regulatory protein